MTEVIDGTKIIAILAEVVEGREKHTAFCAYRTMDGNGGQRPECIAGVAIYKIGGQEALMSLVEGAAIRGFLPSPSRNVPVLESLNINEEAARILQVAQTVQDDGHTWGTAFQRAQELAAQLMLEASE